MKDCIPRLKDFLSFEFLFLLFIYAGTFKGGTYLQSLNSILDLTLVFFVASVLLAGFIILKPGKKPVGQISKQYLVVFFLFLSYCFFNFLITEPGPYSVEKTFRFLILGGWVVAAPLLVIRTDESRINRFIRLTWLYFIIFALSFLVTGVSGIEQVGGLGGSNYQALGNLAAMAIVICLSLFNFQKSKNAKLILLIISGILIIPLIYSGSRQSILGLVLCLAIVFMLLKLERKIVYISIFAFLLVLGVVFLNLTSSSLSDNNALDLRMQRFQWAMNTSDQGESINLRYRFWSSALILWADHPFQGYGFGKFPETNDIQAYPHNQIMEVMAETGTIGLILLLLIYLTTVKAIFKAKIFKTWQGQILTLITSFYFISAMVSGDLVSQRNLFSFGAMVCIYADSLLTKESSQPAGKNHSA
jgi:oligosaccharide repeat unit polymerase